MDKVSTQSFYRKCNRILHICTNSEYQASPRGEGPGDEASVAIDGKYQAGTDFPSFQVVKKVSASNCVR